MADRVDITLETIVAVLMLSLIGAQRSEPVTFGIRGPGCAIHTASMRRCGGCVW